MEKADAKSLFFSAGVWEAIFELAAALAGISWLSSSS